MSLLSQLQTLNLYPKIYWRDRGGLKAIAGAGMGTGKNRFGWRHFTPSSAPHWADFLPSFEFSPKVFLECDGTDHPHMNKPNVKQMAFAPQQSVWSDRVHKAKEAIAKGLLNKVVLARECTLQLEHPLDPWPLVAALEKKAVNAFVFCLQPTPRTAFLGASPERLFFRSGSSLQTEALAGTGQGESLLRDPKNRCEFNFVENSICDALSPFVETPLIFSPPTIRATSSVQHIYSLLQTTLKKEVSDAELLNCLHPTGALAGYPKHEAMRLLQELEPFERGLYGAPIGRLNDTESEWIVAIRSCLLFESTARLYSGTGIVEGSDPTLEWEELNHKLGIYKGIFL